jgi:hypothetical protein
MREMPVAGEPMGIEAAEEPLVGTPAGDPFTLASAPTFPTACSAPPPPVPGRLALALATFLFAVDRVIEVEES